MPGVRRRLRDVTKKVSGVLAGAREETPGDPPAAHTAPPDGPEDAPPPAVEPAPPSTAAPDDQEDAAVKAAPPAAPQPPDEAAGPAAELDLPVDEVCAATVETARAAAVDVAGAVVGDHLGVEGEPVRDGGHAVTHSFATSDPAYVGWRWAVTVARAEGSDVVTVDEVVLLPGRDALLAPAWVPWSERVQPGDLGPGDLLPPPADDPRLVPSYADVDAERLPFDLHRELGLGRARVLSRDGRADAAERWYEGPAGPDAPVAKAAPAPCRDCGFLVPLAGALGRVFGACANAVAPDDGRVVALTHGCGAHSETIVEQPESSYAGMAVELEELEVVEGRPAVQPPADDAPAAGTPAEGAGEAYQGAGA